MEKLIKSSAQIRAEWKERLEKAENKGEELSLLTQELSIAIATEKSDEFTQTATMLMQSQADKPKGLRQLTADETKYYENLSNSVMGATQSVDADIVIPTTIINKVFDDLKSKYPLLSKIKTTPAGITKWIISDFYDTATWGKLDDAIVKEISTNLSEIEMTAKKLSAFITIPKSIIELGYEWLDKYIRDCLAEAMYKGLENGIINGDGKDAPIGMTKDLDNSQNGVYADKTKVAITDFTPSGYGNALVSLTKNGKRTLTDLIMIVNPNDFITKITPALSYRTNEGVWVQTLPIKTEIIQCTAVEEGSAIVGFSNRYLLGLTNTNIKKYTETLATEDLDLYIAKSLGNGQPEDNDSFIVLDLSTLDGLNDE